MTREEIIERLDKGELAIDLVIEKYENLNPPDYYNCIWVEKNMKASSCAFCVESGGYLFGCTGCPLVKYGQKCSSDVNEEYSYWELINDYYATEKYEKFHETIKEFINFLKDIKRKEYGSV